MKRYWTLAILAFVTLGSAAVWLGALNQDEGWYLYAANLVSEGETPYRDFFFTQGPVLPYVYSFFTGIWRHFGLLGARILNLSIGLAGILFASALAYRLASDEHRRLSALITFFLLATNLYHLYYLAIPKTYALAGLFVLIGFYLLSFETKIHVAFGALALGFAAGTRISLGALLPVVALALLWKRPKLFVPFVFGGTLALALIYGPFCFDQRSLSGLLSAQAYHSARTGSDIVWTVGSLSRLVRWYLPIFVVLALGDFRRARLQFAAFLAAFFVQIVAPFPYEDYQVPVMALLAVFAAVNLKTARAPLLSCALCFSLSFGSPLLQDWMTNGQDRFWSLKKAQPELAQLREVARRIESMDPGGKMLLTQDLYLAIETNRKVPKGLEMGPFAMLSDREWCKLLMTAHESCSVAALSGYTFAIEPPSCRERDLDTQLEYWWLLEQNYDKAFKVESFGQNATTLVVLKRK